MNTNEHQDGEPHETSQYVSGWLRSIPSTGKIDINNYTRNQHPGKFEGERAETEYFYEQMLDGDGEQIFAYLDEDEYLEDTPCAQIFTVTADEAEAFGLTVGATFMIREDSQGFVWGSVHASPEMAEGFFRAWLGLPESPEDSK